MQCSGKAPYTEKKAWEIAKKYRGMEDFCHAYHCRICGAWHIGRDARMMRAAEAANGE